MNLTFLKFLLLICHHCCFNVVFSELHGRYTKSIIDYHLAIPHKLTAEGEFSTFQLPHFHEHSIEGFEQRRKRSLDDPDLIHYGIPVHDNLHHVELWPNRAFLHPSMVVERRDPRVEIKSRHVRGLNTKKLCYYTGKVRGIANSTAALSTCDGLAGHISVGKKTYYIEPVDAHSPNEEGQHLHIVYDRKPKKNSSFCGTNERWEEAMKRNLRELAKHGKNINVKKRGLESKPKYLEIMVVCDKTFLEFHKGRDVELYVLTLWNSVSNYYYDASIGSLVNIVIVRMIYLEKEEEEIDLKINRDASKTLKSFCNWTEKLIPPMESPNHHDMAALLSRYDLCLTEGELCTLNGLATVGGACQPNIHCSVNEDTGLPTGLTIAHETGHLLGADHDGQQTSCASQDKDGTNFVMAPFAAPRTSRWSSCSRAYINALFDGVLGECLYDTPESSLYPIPNNMPGVVYDVDSQCKFWFPESLGFCRAQQSVLCESVFCLMEADKCTSNMNMAADGTKCDENKWCFQGKCVEMGSRPAAVNGGWGEWGEWSNCSKPCGIGVMTMERDCNNPTPANGGRFCVGEKRKVKTCNTERCPEGTPTFRQQQCNQLSKKNWTAHFSLTTPCVLLCINEKKEIARLSSSVKDGTLCKPGTKNICVQGVCTSVGCDGQFDSEAVEDRCGICNGDGTQCKIVEGVFPRMEKHHGPVKVVDIPSGARKIMIEETKPAGCLVIIADSTGNNEYVNANNTRFLAGVYLVGKDEAVLSYPQLNMEKIVMHGPLKEGAMVKYRINDFSNNATVKYKWAEPDQKAGYTPHYSWEAGEYTECSVLCGGGIQKATLNCMEEQAGKVSSKFCIGLQKSKDVEKKCNEEPCKTKWKVGEWGRCRACKNKGGVRIRDVVCIKENSKRGGDDILVEDSECEDTKPGFFELCEAAHKCKSKRMISHIPGKYQDVIWSQMNKPRVKKEHRKCTRPTTTSEPQDDLESTVTPSVSVVPTTTSEPKDDLESTVTQSVSVVSTTTSESKDDLESTVTQNVSAVSINVGKDIKDYQPVDKIMVQEYRIPPANASQNISDKMMEEVGDNVENAVNTVRVFTGKDALKMERTLAQSKTTKNPHNVTRKGS